jgi:putative sterol carrier protein
MAGPVTGPEALAVFSDAWARACAARLNGMEGYRIAAARWETIIVLTMTELGEGLVERRVWLALSRGECREARAAHPEDEDTARYVLSGSAETWRQVLGGALPPLMAIMTGKLRLAKGSLMELVPYVNAARELVSAAALVPALFPEPR